MPLNNPKVFGIGFHKTGTTSLAAALATLGYKVTGPNGKHNPNISRDVLVMAFKLVEEYDAFQDNPWPIIYKELDKKYPGSKFILTIRPTASWIASVKKHFVARDSSMREWIYGVGSPQGNEDIFISRYENHNREVLDYFQSRPGDLLVLQITEGDAWDKLCSFLDKKIPETDFPYLNKARKRRKDKKLRQLYNWLRRGMKRKP